MYVCIHASGVTSHLFEVGSSSHRYVTHVQHIKEARPLVGKNAKMVVSCCAFGCRNRHGERPGLVLLLNII